MKGTITTHTIAFAPGMGPGLLDRFLWEQLPLIARKMGEKELLLRIAPEKPFSQWHAALRTSKPFVQAYMDKLLARQSHFGIKTGFKERPGEGEIILQLPLAHADEFLSANNIFLQACMPFLRVEASSFSVDFSKCDSSHLLVEGETRAMEKFTAFVRNPKLLMEEKNKKKTKPRAKPPKKARRKK